LEDQVTTLEQQQAELSGAVEINGIMIALGVLGSAGLHDIDESANENNEVVEGAAGPVDDAILAMSAVTWPEELQAGADGVIAALEELSTALDSADPAVVGPPAATAHDTAHDFEEEAAAHVAEAAGVPVEEHEDGGASETPAAGETPVEEAETPAGG
jgi:hypothetical protein